MSDDTLKQWQQDVADYGDNAYQMWGLRDSNYSFSNNADVNKHFCLNIPKWQVRKESAALPFDLERAKAGDAVEYEEWNSRKRCYEWDNCTLTLTKDGNDYKHSDYNNYVFVHGYGWQPASTLRMKYPPKVAK